MNIYVGNLPLETTEDELRDEFAPFGEVLSVTLMNDKYIGSGQPRCYGYVEMASKSRGAAAIAKLNGKKIGNRVVDIIEALPLSGRKGILYTDTKNNYRSNKRRQRRYPIIQANPGGQTI